MAYYLVYRTYSFEEMPNASEEERRPLYGWTCSKDVIKAFCTQRNPDKYLVRKVSEHEVGEMLSEVAWDDTNEIDFLILRVASTGEEVKLFMTKSEMEECEIRIQRYFRELADIVSKQGYGVLDLYVNLRKKYLEPLYVIGFNPMESIDMDDTGMYRGLCTDEYMVDWEIHQAYQSNDKFKNNILGLQSISSIHGKVIYSLESFLKVMREDL